MTLSRFLDIFEMRRSLCTHTHTISNRGPLLSPLIYVRQIIQFIPDCKNAGGGVPRKIKFYLWRARTNERHSNLLPSEKIGRQKYESERGTGYAGDRYRVFRFRINDYRELGGIVCGRNRAIYTDARRTGPRGAESEFGHRMYYYYYYTREAGGPPS